MLASIRTRRWVVGLCAAGALAIAAGIENTTGTDDMVVTGWVICASV